MTQLLLTFFISCLKSHLIILHPPFFFPQQFLKRYFDYGGDTASFAPPPSLCRALLLAAGAAGLPSHLAHAITPSTLATAHGTAVIEVGRRNLVFP
jgi:hypothetical protein